MKRAPVELDGTCDGCPFLYDDAEQGWLGCQAPVAGTDRRPEICGPGGRHPAKPEWCPLRSGPIIVGFAGDLGTPVAEGSEA